MSGTCIVPYQQKRKPEMRSVIEASMDVVPPIDFSFCRIENIEGAIDEEPRPPVSPRGKGKHRAQEGDRKSSGRCLKLNNNAISSLAGLKPFVQAKFSHWQAIAWIDLSHNELTVVGAELTELESLQILYLHGNQIQDPAQIDQLIPLKTLRKLTLHGNPVENIKGYRFLVLCKLPQLQCLDFSLVTKADRMTMSTLDRMNSWGTKKKKKTDSDE